jgi:hypothetical protein
VQCVTVAGGLAAFALFPAVEDLARRHGHADILDAWGGDLERIRSEPL